MGVMLLLTSKERGEKGCVLDLVRRVLLSAWSLAQEHATMFLILRAALRFRGRTDTAVPYCGLPPDFERTSCFNLKIRWDKGASTADGPGAGWIYDDA